METKVLSTGVPYLNLPESYIRPVSERPRLSEVSDCEDVPIIDLGIEDRSQIVRQIGDACKIFGFFQVNHIMRSSLLSALSLLHLKSCTNSLSVSACNKKKKMFLYGAINI